MDIESLRTTVVEFVRHNQAWAPFIVAFLAFGESLAFLSLLFPATVILVGIGAVIGGLQLGFWPVWAGAVAGAVIGDWLSYEFGHHFKDRVHDFWPLNRHRDLIDRGEAFSRKYGVWAIFLGRFFGPLRAFVPLVAGIFEMPRPAFQFANVSSALLWAYLLLTVGDVAGDILTYIFRLFQA
jgi:membrane protein DedA with SNARE-associated domain